jgi:glycosyltransferase involved in cell wall biosynthesis
VILSISPTYLALRYNMPTVNSAISNGTIVSVIVATKNSASTLKACLKSIRKQTHPSIELLVIDNFSTDETPKISRAYADIFEQKGPERSAQRNYGASRAKGEYVVFIDSDMELSPTVIAEAVQALNTAGTTGVIIPEESFGKGFWAQCKKLERSFYVGVSYMEAARFFRTRTFRKVGGYNADLVSGEDWDLSQRIEHLGKLGRTQAYIYHNEGHISLLKTIQKKYYYAQKFSAYQATNRGANNLSKQTGLIGRYWLFLSHPWRLFRNPLLGFGMLFMKTCEFGVGGLGYLSVKFSGSQK